MRQVGSVEVPQSAFLAVFEIRLKSYIWLHNPDC